jgi:hypothetical protein
MLHCHSERSEEATIEAVITQGTMYKTKTFCEVLRFAQDDTQDTRPSTNLRACQT